MKPKVIVIVGPTAVGKTALGVEVAKKLDGEVVSADSMQIYKYMNIATAKPTLEEMQGIKHHLIDFVEPTTNFSVVEYKDLAEKCIDEIFEKGMIPIVVGGTGLYVNALVNNIQFSESNADLEYRKELEQIAQKEGNKFLHDMLNEIDPQSAKKIEINDLKRIIRALEIFKTTGKTMTYHNEQSKLIPSKYDFRIFGLTMDRDGLYDRINIRIDLMLKNGLLDEVKQILDMNIGLDKTSMQGIGYKEFIPYFKNEAPLNECVELLKQQSRRYAKRQFTWFRANKKIVWIDATQNLEFKLNKIIDNYAL